MNRFLWLHAYFFITRTTWEIQPPKLHVDEIALAHLTVTHVQKTNKNIINTSVMDLC